MSNRQRMTHLLPAAVVFAVMAAQSGQAQAPAGLTLDQPVWRRGDQAEFIAYTIIPGPGSSSFIFRYRKVSTLIWRGRFATAPRSGLGGTLYLAAISLVSPEDGVDIVPGLGFVNNRLPPEQTVRYRQMVELYLPSMELVLQGAADRAVGPWEEARITHIQWSFWSGHLRWPLAARPVQTNTGANGTFESEVTSEKVDLGVLGQLDALRYHSTWTPPPGSRAARTVYSAWFAKEYSTPIKVELSAGRTTHRYILTKFSPGTEPF